MLSTDAMSAQAVTEPTHHTAFPPTRDGTARCRCMHAVRERRALARSVQSSGREAGGLGSERTAACSSRVEVDYILLDHILLFLVRYKFYI